MFIDYHLQTASSSIQSKLKRSCSDKMFGSGTDEIAGSQEQRMLLTNHRQHHSRKTLGRDHAQIVTSVLWERFVLLCLTPLVEKAIHLIQKINVFRTRM